MEFKEKIMVPKGISFFADGQVEMDITKYDLFAEE